MYKEKFDILPANYWILSEGNVDILPLDTGQELIEDRIFGATQLPLVASRNVIDDAIVPEICNDHSIDKTNGNDKFLANDVASQEKIKLLLELPNGLCLMICFQNTEDAEEYHDKIANAKNFQVNLMLYMNVYQ